MERKQLIKFLKNACLPLLQEIREETGLNDFEKKLFTQRYINDNLILNVMMKINCSNTKFYKDHERILNKINSYLDYKKAKN